MFMKANPNNEILGNSQTLYPDFYKDNFIIDAKYKHLNNGIERDDLYQVVTYMYCTKSNFGGYLYPDENKKKSCRYQLMGYNGYIYLLPFHIPQYSQNYEMFIEEIRISEDELIKAIKDIH